MNEISQLQFEVNLIKNATVRNLVENILKYKSPNYFWTVASSSTGHYHPSKDGQPISLIEHTKSATRILSLLLSHPLVAGQVPELTKDLMIGAIIIHDVAKRGVSDVGDDYTVHEHPILISLLAPQSMTTEEEFYFKEMIRLAITHQGPWRWSSISNTVLPEITDYCQYLVHLADWLSSRLIFHVDTTDTDKIFNYLKDR